MRSACSESTTLMCWIDFLLVQLSRAQKESRKVPLIRSADYKSGETTYDRHIRRLLDIDLKHS